MPSFDPNALREGTVYKKSNGLYAVHTLDQIVACELSSKLRKDLVTRRKMGALPPSVRSKPLTRSRWETAYAIFRPTAAAV